MRAPERVFSFIIALTFAGFVAIWGGSRTVFAAARSNWQLTDVSGHLPDLQFDMTSDQNKRVTQNDLRGDVTLLFFGFTSCPDECPTTMLRMTGVLKHMGRAADHVRLLFVTVDPTVDTPQVLHDYLKNFDPQHMIGLTGRDGKVRGLAQRYRAAYQPRKAGGNEEDIGHSAALYIFDAEGRARLIASPTDSDNAIEHDLHQLVESGSSP